ncbi:hypothetical protein DICVIV_04976 [Dictyocaulus viviparus]|uniref:Serpentine receptor class gamma n=1 Tax=Dictyocaulus viviparus TaxID=29172 RepID=A0A0D8Y2U9_DICVI|nr:hypothetical protein DICVIV_04976 [Dictyocaulus viviparus]
MEQLINVSHRWTLPIFQWTIPLIYSIPFFTVDDVKFLSENNLELIAKREEITLVNSMTALFVSVTFVLCSICYGALLRFLIKNRYNNDVAIKREFRLYIQMLGLFIAFALLLVFHVTLMVFSFDRNDGPVFTMRIIFPIITAFMSYINSDTRKVVTSTTKSKQILMNKKKSIPHYEVEHLAIMIYILHSLNE